MRYCAAIALLLTIACQGQAADAKPPAGFQVRTLKGFTVLVHDDVFAQPADRWQRKPLDVLELEFEDLRRILNPKIFDIVRSVPIWVRWHSPDPMAPGAVAFYYGQSAAYLQRVGKDPLLTHSIELVTLKRLGELRPPGSKFQQVVLLHELAHAVHHRLLGFEAAEVKTAFQAAMDRKLYDNVPDRTGRRGPAYARTNANEYFAEISCAYLDSCYFYPYTYSDLKEHDSVGFALMESVWKRPEQFAGRGSKVEAPHFGGADSTGTGLTGVAAERAAFVQLDKARALVRTGKKADALPLLDALLKNYPTSLAADDARRLRGQLR